MESLILTPSSQTRKAAATKSPGARQWASGRMSKRLHRTGLLLAISLIAVLALCGSSTWVQSSISAALVQGIKVVEPFCTNFNDNSLHGWSNGGSQVKVEIKNPGPTGAASDLYFHATDKSGTSWISASPEYRGDWTKLAEKGCGALCFDFRLFKDGLFVGQLDAHIGDDQLCTTSSGPCPTGTFRPIRPSLILISDPDGPGGNPPLRAVYRANTFVTENGGSNPGWHHICAPVALLANGNLPSDANGGWEMADNAPNSSWNGLLANVTDIQFPIDFTGNPAEEVGYDNFCFRDDACPQTSDCATIAPPGAVCKRDGSGYTYTFSVTNNSGKNVEHILLTPHGGGLTLPKQIFETPLKPGESTTITVELGGIKPGTKPCFYVTLMTKEGPCCTVEVCPILPDCCATATGEFGCDPRGGYRGTFTIVNTSPNTIKNIYLYPPAGVTMSQTYFAVSLAPGQSFTTPVISITGAKPGRFCFRVSMHTEDMKECCEVEVCIVLPECGKQPGAAAIFVNPADGGQAYDPRRRIPRRRGAA